MAMQELNSLEINEIAGGLTIGTGTGALTFDLNGMIDNLQSTLNGILDSLQGQLNTVVDKVPGLPPITIPGLGLTIALTLTR